MNPRPLNSREIGLRAVRRSTVALVAASVVASVGLTACAGTDTATGSTSTTSSSNSSNSGSSGSSATQAASTTTVSSGSGSTQATSSGS